MLINDVYIASGEVFACKFLRTGNEIYITEPDDLKTQHSELAKKHNLLERIEKLKFDNKDEVDGGIFFINGKVIRVGDVSETLSLPLTAKARLVTVKKLHRQKPDFMVKQIAD